MTDFDCNNEKEQKRKYGVGCQGCIYRRRLSNSFRILACHFCIDTGELRGCPPGEGCKRYCNDPKLKKKLKKKSKEDWVSD